MVETTFMFALFSIFNALVTRSNQSKLNLSNNVWLHLLFILDFHDSLNRNGDQNLCRSRSDWDWNTTLLPSAHTETHTQFDLNMLMRQLNLCFVSVSDSRPTAERGSFLSRIKENKPDIWSLSKQKIYFCFGQTHIVFTPAISAQYGICGQLTASSFHANYNETRTNRHLKRRFFSPYSDRRRRLSILHLAGDFRALQALHFVIWTCLYVLI